MQFFDPEVMGQVIGEFAERGEALLQGRRTYQVSAAVWPERGGDPFADWINRVQKYVVSDTLSAADLTWEPTTVIRGADLVKEVRATGARILLIGDGDVAAAISTSIEGAKAQISAAGMARTTPRIAICLRP